MGSNELNEIRDLYDHFGINELKAIEFLEKCANNTKMIKELETITGAIGYSKECLEDLIYGLEMTREWLKTLSQEQKAALLAEYSDEVGRAIEIKTGKDGQVMITMPESTMTVYMPSGRLVQKCGSGYKILTQWRND